MRRIIVSALCSAALMLGVAACGSSSKPSPATPGTGNTPTTVQPAKSGGGYGY